MLFSAPLNPATLSLISYGGISHMPIYTVLREAQKSRSSRHSLAPKCGSTKEPPLTELMMICDRKGFAKSPTASPHTSRMHWRHVTGLKHVKLSKGRALRRVERHCLQGDKRIPKASNHQKTISTASFTVSSIVAFFGH